METSNTNTTVAVPTVSAETPRVLATGVVVANVAAGLVAAGIIAAMHRSDWWPALLAAGVIAMLCAIASVLVLAKAAGNSIEWLVTFVMGASAVRMGVSLVGLLVAVKTLKTPAEATGFLICGFYAVTLIVESSLLNRVLRKSAVAQVGETHV